MNPTRRAFCGLGIASVPLAVLGRPLLSAGQEPAGAGDSFLSYLVEDTKKNCRLAGRPGRGRAQAFRRLGANLEVSAAYLHSREPIGRVKELVGRKGQAQGIDALADHLREGWRDFAAGLAREYGIPIPPELDHQTVTNAIRNVQRHGCPRLGGARAWLEREADRIERLEGRVAVAIPVQTPGNDFGPLGWSAGIGDPVGVSCWDLGLLLAALYLTMDVLPELAIPLRVPTDILAVVFTWSASSETAGATDA